MSTFINNTGSEKVKVNNKFVTTPMQLQTYDNQLIDYAYNYNINTRTHTPTDCLILSNEDQVFFNFTPNTIYTEGYAYNGYVEYYCADINEILTIDLPTIWCDGQYQNSATGQIFTNDNENVFLAIDTTEYASKNTDPISSLMYLSLFQLHIEKHNKTLSWITLCNKIEYNQPMFQYMKSFASLSQSFPTSSHSKRYNTPLIYTDTKCIQIACAYMINENTTLNIAMLEYCWEQPQEINIFSPTSEAGYRFENLGVSWYICASGFVKLNNRSVFYFQTNTYGTGQKQSHILNNNANASLVVSKNTEFFNNYTYKPFIYTYDNQLYGLCIHCNGDYKQNMTSKLRGEMFEIVLYKLNYDSDTKTFSKTQTNIFSSVSSSQLKDIYLYGNGELKNIITSSTSDQLKTFCNIEFYNGVGEIQNTYTFNYPKILNVSSCDLSRINNEIAYINLNTENQTQPLCVIKPLNDNIFVYHDSIDGGDSE